MTGLQPGQPALFTGDWLAYDRDGTTRYEAAFEGWFLSVWAGGTNWECTQPVAQAVMGEQERMRHDEFGRLITRGFTREDAQRRVDEGIAPISWDGDVLVFDFTAAGGDVVRCVPNERGRYEPVGWLWCWHTVDPRLVDVVHRG